MRIHPHRKWVLKYPSIKPVKNAPCRVAKKFYLEGNRLYARTWNFFIRKKDLPPQADLNDREVQLQDFLKAERPTRGNGSPIYGNPQQVFTFSATDKVSTNTVLDDFIELIDPLPDYERELEFIMIPSVSSGSENTYQRMVDRSHRSMVHSLLGEPLDMDVARTMRVDSRLSAQGF